MIVDNKENGRRALKELKRHCKLDLFNVRSKTTNPKAIYCFSNIPGNKNHQGGLFKHSAFPLLLLEILIQCVWDRTQESILNK